jgi:glycine/D-amino acid oxidase-like deaminating enzyme
MQPGGLAACSLADAQPVPYWLDRAGRPGPRPPLTGTRPRDLVIVGGGFSGLWTALLAKERDPGRDVLLVEGERIGWAASGRNGGFCSPSLTHGHANGAARFPREIDRLQAAGRRNLDEIEETVQRYGIECDFRRPGTISVATAPHQVRQLRALGGTFLDQDAVRAELDSPTYLAGHLEPGEALVDPARLAWGLARAAESLGVTIAEATPVTGLRRCGQAVAVRTAAGVTVHARHVALATNAFPALVRRLRFYTVPVYDYVLATEPLTPGQLAAIGWARRQGISDQGNQFHYYRLTAGHRIIWGGYDAIYHFGRRVRAGHDQRPQTFATLAEHFHATFPQLEGIRFTHKWGGAIDTCSRFCAFFGTAMDGLAAYALGYTGLGVGATRFGANVMLDLLDRQPTERTQLKLVRTKPIPFPPEPLAYPLIQATRASLARADLNDGKRNLWLRTLDRLGLGFDS